MPIEPKLPVAIGELVGGKYAIESIIGSGGMGVIAAARHVQLDQRVALKFLHAQVLSNDQAVARFLREARATVRLKSDHVARVFDVDTLPTGEPYAVMELLEGVDLASYAREAGRLRIAEAVEFVVQACEGIVEAHALGIVHRDLKPQNLFVTRRINGSPRIKVLDFGISKSIGGADMSLTDSAVILGSPLYMAPEQMKASRNVDVRSDIWSLGIILYELLTGSVPFDGESITELCLKVVTAAPRAPREVRGEIPDAVAAIVLRCLEKDPAHRFGSVAALAEALEPFSAGAERGLTDRTWRSLAETADALDKKSFFPLTPPPAASTHSTWDKLAEPPTRRRGFYRGLAIGLAVAGALGAAAFMTRSSPAPSAEAPRNQIATLTGAGGASIVETVLVPAAGPASVPPVAAPAPEKTTPVADLPEDPARKRPAKVGRPKPEPKPSEVPAAPSAAAPPPGDAFRTTANGAPILP